MSDDSPLAMAYQYLARNETALVQQLVRYVQAGYRFYIVGSIGRKSAEAVDERLLTKFDIRKSPQQRSRAKGRGESNLQYIRLDDFWVILATKGKHPFFGAHRTKQGRAEYKDLRRTALRVGPYAISSKLDGAWNQKNSNSKLSRYRVRVTLTRDEYKELQAFFEEKASHWSQEKLAAEFEKKGRFYLPYRPIRNQLVQLVRRTNKVRKLCGFKPISYSALNIPSHAKSETVFRDVSS